MRDTGPKSLVGCRALAALGFKRVVLLTEQEADLERMPMTLRVVRVQDLLSACY